MNSIRFDSFSFHLCESFSIWSAICRTKWRKRKGKRQQFSNYIFLVLFMGLTKTATQTQRNWAQLDSTWGCCCSLSIVKWSFDWHLNTNEKNVWRGKKNSQKKYHQIRIINLKQISNFSRFRWRIGQQHQQQQKYDPKKYEETHTHTHIK